MLRRLVETLDRYGPLAEEDRAAVTGLPLTTRKFAAGEDVVHEGETPNHCCILLTGIAFRHRTLADGRRQIMAFNVPGEVCDTEGLLLAMDHTVTVLMSADMALVAHAALEPVLETHPRVMRALWRANLVENAISREWMVGMGRRTARARIAHLFCEMAMRLKAAGLEQNGRFTFPVTQAHLSDCLGLSVVHTNRVLQDLRGSGLIALRGGAFQVLNLPGLQVAGEFDPSYLHLKSRRVGEA